MKMTLLEMVQDILNDMDSEPVDTLDDSDEAIQVASIVRQSYFALMSNREWPHLRRGTNLEPSSDSTKPTHMKLDDKVTNLLSLNYNKVKATETRDRYSEIKYLDNDSFLRVCNNRNSDSDNVIKVTDGSGITFSLLNNKQPDYYTSFDDEFIVFDSYDSGVEPNLQDSKVQATAYVMPTWDEDESSVPDLPANAFTALLEEAKSRSFYRLKQMNDPKAEREAAKQQAYLSRNARKVERAIKYPNYGRRSRK